MSNSYPLYSLWLFNKDTWIKYATAGSKKQLTNFVPSITVDFQEWRIQPEFPSWAEFQSDTYEVYCDGALQATFSTIDKLVNYYKNWTEQALKTIQIVKITRSKVHLLR